MCPPCIRVVSGWTLCPLFVSLHVSPKLFGVYGGVIVLSVAVCYVPKRLEVCCDLQPSRGCETSSRGLALPVRDLGPCSLIFASTDFPYITRSELSDFLFGLTQPKDCGSSCLSLESDLKSCWKKLAAVRCPNWQKECDGTYVAAWKCGDKVVSSRGW